MIQCVKTMRGKIETLKNLTVCSRMATLKYQILNAMNSREMIFGFEYGDDIYLQLIFLFRISNEAISFKLFAYNLIKRRIIRTSSR